MGTCNSTSNNHNRTEKHCITLPSTNNVPIDLSPKQSKALKFKEKEEHFSLKKITTGITKSSSTKTVCQAPFLMIPTSMMYPLRKDVPTLHYTIKDKVGIGSFGTVFQAENQKLHTKLALKKIIKTSTTNDEFKSELSVLRNCSHPNIITLHECYETKKAYYLATTLCQYDLYSQLGKKYSECQLADMFFQLLSALSYLHKKQVVHRDLKLENIMIFDTEVSKLTKETFYYIKLIDFGTTTPYPRHDKEIVGSAYYLAPEVICDNYYTDKCDIWSAGIILYMLLTQKSPYKAIEGDSLSIIEEAKRVKFKVDMKDVNYCSDELKELLNILLEVDFNKRPSAKEILTHKWFKLNCRKSFYTVNQSDNERLKKSIESIVTYKSYDSFTKIVLMYICRKNSFIDNPYYNKLFWKINKSRDGFIKKKELYNELKNYYTDLYIDDIYESICCSIGNKYIEYIDFVSSCVDKKLLCKSEKYLKDAYDSISNDVNSDIYKIIFDSNEHMLYEDFKQTIMKNVFESE